MNIKSDTSTWTAWYNAQPPGPHTLHVTGQIDVGNESVGAQLVFAGIEKSQSPNLILRVIEIPIFIPRSSGNHIVYLHYSEIARIGSYGNVKIVHEQAIIKEISDSEIGIVY